jgi:hypothetical protein
VPLPTYYSSTKVTMKFPLQAVRHLLLCTAFPIGGGGGGKNFSSPSPDKKRQRGAAHPDPPTSKSDDVDIDKELTPKMDGASLGGDDESDCGVVLGQQQQQHSCGSDDDYFEGVDGEENNIIYSMTDEEIVNNLSEYNFEASLDNGEDESKPAARGETRGKVIQNTDDAYQLRGGAFAKHYDGLLKDETPPPGFKAFIIKLVKWVNSIELHAFGTAKEMETKFNQKRDDILKEMKAALKSNHNEELAETINLASKFSVSSLIVFFLHYAPDGCNPMDDDDSNFCHLDQVRSLLCCSLFYYYCYNSQITHNIIIFIVLYLNDGKETTQLLHQ